MKMDISRLPLFVYLVLWSLSLGIAECAVRFSQDEYVFGVPETPASDSNVPSLSSTQPEEVNVTTIDCVNDGNASSTLSITEGSDIATIHSTTGVFSVATYSLDYETQPQYTFRLLCSISTDSSINASATLTLNILPVNEYLPDITSEGSTTVVRTITEDTPLGTTIAAVRTGALITLTVSDEDEGPDGVIFFSLSENSDVFDLNEVTGELKLKRAPDTDIMEALVVEYGLRIIACNEPIPTTECNYLALTVYVSAVNDIAPQYDSSLYQVSLLETSLNGSLVAEPLCTDGDYGPGSEITVSFHTNTSAIVLNTFLLLSNASIILQETLDYETGPINYEFELVCSDGVHQAVAIVSVEVLPVNDNSPQFLLVEYEFRVERSSSVGQTVGQLRAEDDDIDSGSNITYFLSDNPYFGIDETSGVLRIKDHIPSSAGSEFNLEAIVTDGEFSANVTVLVLVIGAISQLEFVAILSGVLMFIVLMVILLFVTGLCALCYIRTTRRRAYGVERAIQRDGSNSAKAVRFADDEFSQYFPSHDRNMLVTNPSAIAHSSSRREHSEEETAFTRARNDDDDTA